MEKQPYRQRTTQSCDRSRAVILVSGCAKRDKAAEIVVEGNRQGLIELLGLRPDVTLDALYEDIPLV